MRRQPLAQQGLVVGDERGCHGLRVFVGEW
jgi:hypothetical protein